MQSISDFYRSNTAERSADSIGGPNTPKLLRRAYTHAEEPDCQRTCFGSLLEVTKAVNARADVVIRPYALAMTQLKNLLLQELRILRFDD